MQCYFGLNIIPLYDNEDSVCGLIYNNTPYYFFKNLQGDIISITNASGDVVANYKYDAWGVCTITSDTSGVNIATINPFRYRGYYYDTEIGMYYLQSRYYNPMVGRFINADNEKLLCQSGNNCNLFVYCNNNPIINIDANGKYWWAIALAILVVVVIVVVIGILVQDFNKVDPPANPNEADFELYLKVHHVYYGNYHSCLVIFTKCNRNASAYYYNGISVADYKTETAKAGYKFFTIVAGGNVFFGFSGELTNGYNRDRDEKLDKAVEMQKLGDKTDNEIKKLVGLNEYYKDNKKLPYSLFPSEKNKYYNSNSFTRGLLDAAGITYNDPTHKVPGWDKPVPKSYFGVSE